MEESILILVTAATPVAFIKLITIYLLSAVKFIGGPLAGSSFGLPMYQTVLCTTAGMMTSVVLFSYIGIAVQRWFLKNRRKTKRIFNKRSRRIVKIWQRFGIRGIAFFTPIVLSPIIGTLIAVVLGAPRYKIIVYMLSSALLWSIAMTVALDYGRHLLQL